MATSLINCLTSFVSGFVIFSVLGYAGHKSGKPITEVADHGPGLVFMNAPKAAAMPGSTFWAIIFFMMLLTLGLDSSFGGSEAVITALSDEFPIIGRNRKAFVAILFTFDFFVGLSCCTQGGFCIVLCSTGTPPDTPFSSRCFARPSLCPGSSGIIIVYGLYEYTPLSADNPDKYPWWTDLLGWAMAGSSMVMIPFVAIYKIVRLPGPASLSKVGHQSDQSTWRLKILTTPWRDQQVSVGNGVRAETNQIILNSDTPAPDSVMLRGKEKTRSQH
ncbi:sodium-dependent dopamine transporter-like [Penaeus japonicus]|uniref:sodium-dependent dopamine transporter-like n=1 Tax=Penaeus japonicus TaxID=27405 RepID=UPI001C70B894|nr:sodium-dependent dopamine transporter-like [Penaeus japonicus]